MIVRPLTADEIPLVFPIGEAFGKEAGVNWNPTFFEGFWRQTYALDMGVILGLFEPGASWWWQKGYRHYDGTPIAIEGLDQAPEKLVGSLGAHFAPGMFDGEMAATECWWYVCPQWRNGSGLLLLDAYEAEAKRRGCKSIALTHLELLQPAKLAALYEARGYTKIETNWRKEAS